MDTTLILVDDHEILRSGLKAMLEGQPGLRVIGEAADGRSAVQLAKDLRPDVVVMDLSMPELNGVDATRQIMGNDVRVRVLCLTGRTDERSIADALDAGAAAFVRKEDAFEELAAAVRAVHAGKTYMSPALDHASRRPIAAADGVAPVNGDGATRGRLSGREREVLQLMAEGKATKEVAASLHVSVKTVETHRANLMKKLNLFSVAELTKYAIRQGLSGL